MSQVIGDFRGVLIGVVFLGLGVFLLTRRWKQPLATAVDQAGEVAGGK